MTHHDHDHHDHDHDHKHGHHDDKHPADCTCEACASVKCEKCGHKHGDNGKCECGCG